MDCLRLDFDDCVDAFLDQMQRGLEGYGSSLEMIPTFLQPAGKTPTNRPVIVADAGGTNFRAATIYFDNDKKPVIENLKKDKMPGVEKELKRDEFFRMIAENLSHTACFSKRIGFCFSYPTEMLPSKDGRLICFAKEIKALEVVGELIGKNLIEAMDAMDIQTPERVIVLNDTVATLLAGVDYQGRQFDSYIGFILGTGTNTSYIEKNVNILKHQGLNQADTMIINVESGGMRKILRGKLDVVFDQSTANPGVHVFEKMISGAYLGLLALLTFKQCAEDGLLSVPTADTIRNLSDLETKELNDFMAYPYGENSLAKACAGSCEDARLLYSIADRLIERAAKLTAVNLSAVAVKTGRGTDPTRPICIVAEGTTFYHMKYLKPRVEFYLKQHLENQRGVHAEIINVENATLIGAAIAGLTN